MIAKEIDKKYNLKTLQKYGHKAEKQMAFYLKRAFEDTEDVFVINDLRLERQGDVAQIDHLIIHKFGFTLVESKSVASKISINAHGEWARHYSQYTKGIPSPVNQVEIQANFLRKFLIAKSEHFFRKKLIFKAPIADFKFDVLVAISDDGIIDRANNTQTAEVYKADQITATIQQFLSDYEAENKKSFFSKENNQFTNAEMKKITQYLLHAHTPKSTTQKESDQVAEVAIKKPSEVKMTVKKTSLDNHYSVKNCGKCNSENIDIAYGNNYYFKCRDCKGNTSIQLKCSNSACKPRIKKEKNRFYQDCESCKKSVLFFINKPMESIEKKTTS